MSQLRLHQDIAGYRFEGPYLGLRRVPQGPGLYAVVSYDGKQYYLLDIGYAKRDVGKNSSKEIYTMRFCRMMTWMKKHIV